MLGQRRCQVGIALRGSDQFTNYGAMLLYECDERAELSGEICSDVPGVGEGKDLFHGVEVRLERARMPGDGHHL